MDLPSLRLRFGFLCIVLFEILFFQSTSTSESLGPSNQSEAYFNGSSYVRLQNTISLKKQTGISFRTCLGGSLFSQQQNDDLIDLSVNAEGVVFIVRSSGQHYEEKIPGDFLDNKWHSVFLQYRLGNLTIDVDGYTELLANATYNNELLTSPNLYDEGAAVLLIGKQFNGCILEGPSIVFDTNLIISKHNVRFEPCPIPDDSCTPRENIKRPDLCFAEPCMRHGTCLSGQTSYTCVCSPRYTGKNCEIDLGDPCEKIPPACQNSGECKSDPSGNFTCTCLPEYSGVLCEHEELSTHPLCKNNPCLNGGTCDVIKDTGNVACSCAAGFSGVNCELEVNECKSNPCKNGGKCIDGINDFTCDCSRTGYKGKMCDQDINECLTNPCLNHGTCFNTYGGFMCQCSTGYGGSHCQYNINECFSQPCKNYGSCNDDEGDYICHCLPGFTGTHCEIQARQGFCDATTCPTYADCVISNNAAKCVCKSDHFGTYPNCTLDNVCSPNPCKNGGRCTAWNGSYNCSCLPGFSGKFCHINVDECVSQPCLNGGTCIDQIDSFFCNCTEQWMGPQCERPYDACELNPCQNNGTCFSSPNKREFNCTCLPGFEGVVCEQNIDDCVDVACPPGRVCVDSVNSYDCHCPPGYAGDDCTLELDPCSKEPCKFGSTCQINPETQTAKCICATGYKGEACDEDIDECLTQGICNHGICVNKKGSFQCYCQPGYTGERCNLDFDECLSMPCQNNAECINQINNYECRCPPGYDGKDCSININECDPMQCKEGSTCIDLVNNFTCVCQPGLTGRLCDIDIDDCKSSPCKNGATCLDGLNSYTCDCAATGYTGEHCEINIDDCSSNPCLNEGVCIDEVKDYYCKCYSGYSGKNCEIDINECDSNPCEYGGTCLERSNITLYSMNSIPSDSYGAVVLPETFSRPFDYTDAAGYECLCKPGVTGVNCETNIDECQSSPCIHGKCIDQIGKFICECENGFEGDLCDVDIDECEKYQPCQHGKCMDRRANYYCECDPNYGGKNCSVALIGCKNQPCLNGGNCNPYLVDENEHKFNCSCKNGFHGQTCEDITTMSLSGDSVITVNTSRDEGYDIQFKFQTTLGDGLLALGKGLTYYILELSKGRLNLHSSLLNKWEGVFIGSNLNDSQWHKVFVAINSTHLVLSANEEQTIYPITFNENYNVSSTSFPVTYIGGNPSNLKKLTHGQPFLVGCIQDVLINGEWVLPGAQNLSWLSLQNVDTGCIRKAQCVPNPCHSGGHCTDLWRDFSCTCERPYLGHTCQYNYTAATFGHENISNSLVVVTVHDQARRAVRTIVDISMFIKTRQSRGQIFYLGSAIGSPNPEETYITAQLEGGELLVRIQFNGTPESYTVGGVKLDNGYNHLIKVIRNVTLVQVKINGTEYFRKTISAPGNLDAQVLFLGGQPSPRPVRQANDNMPPANKMDVTPQTTSAATTTPLSNVNFKGIIQDVQISNGSAVMVVEFFPLQAKDVQVPMSFGIVSFDKSTVLKGVLSDDSCRSNPCIHNGICENTWNDYRCECPRGFKGKDCDEQEFCELEHCPQNSQCKNLEDGYECIANATFTGKSNPLRYLFSMNSEALKKDLEIDDIKLTYRTRSWGTLLFAKYNEDYFVIFVYHNEVVVEWRISEILTTKRFKKDHFEGQWLTLYFTMKDNTFRGGFKDLVMDDIPNFEITDFDVPSFIKIFSSTIYVAGSDDTTFDFRRVIENSDVNSTYIPLPETTTSVSLTSNSLENEVITEDASLYKVDQNKTSDRFKGCLSEIRIGGMLLPFFTAEQLNPQNHYYQQLFELDSRTKPDIGCILCYETDCYNGGQCHSSEEVYKCDCLPGYTADDCSVDINECENAPCTNNSTCIDLVADYECRCLPGYEGRHCESDIDECASNPCRHGGTCLDQIGTFKCECPEEFVGKQCEAPLLITCDNKPCGKGATCKTGLNITTGRNFTCSCSKGMEGILCDTPFCMQQPCENGICNVTEDFPFCQCLKGFEGRFCELNIDDCVSPTGGSPCQNGGICVDSVNRYDCNCTGTGYNGLLCEMDIDECMTDARVCGGDGECINLPGTFMCNCTSRRLCGHYCSLPDPCEVTNPCIHGTCLSKCTTVSDYDCINCKDNYGGKNCSELMVAASQGDNGLNILYIVIPVILAILIAFAIGMAVLVNIARSKRATRGTYSPSAQEFCNPRVELDLVLKPPPEERLI